MPEAARRAHNVHMIFDYVISLMKQKLNMSKSRERISPPFFALLLAIPLFLDGERLCKAIRVRNSGENGVCDDGKHLVDKDLGGEENWRCPTSKLTVTQFMEQAGHSQCGQIIENTDRCMEDDVSYSAHPPSSGDYRPLAPKYGEYKYLPPQRWLHALQRGGLAFLYHPCTPEEQVMKLKELAKSCLRRHVITPYLNLTKNEPLAIVSWGCVYRMSWVKVSDAQHWIKDHALKTDHSSIDEDGQYDEGLLHSATLTNDDICPEKTGHSDPSDTPQHATDHSNPPPCQKYNSTTTTTAGTTKSHDLPLPPCPALSSGYTNSPPAPTIIIPMPHGNTLTILIALLSLVLCIALLIVLWRVCAAVRERCVRKKQARYKSVSKFFPFSYGQDSSNGVAIPEYGLPKNRAAEREILLNDSDEDEL